MIPETDVPYPRRGRLWDDTLTGIQRLRRVDFLLGLGLDPTCVPDGARIEFDTRTSEYRLQVINPGGHLVWVRRLWSPPPPRPRSIGAIADDLMALRDRYARPYAERHLPEPEPAVFDRARYEAARDAYLAQLPHRRPIVEDPMRLFPTGGHRPDVVIIDDPVRPSLPVTIAAAATADRWYNEMRAART